VDALKILLEMPNVSVSSQNKLGDTALHAAAWKGFAECVQLLLQAGGNVSVRNIEKKTAYDLATNPEAAALLKRASGTGTSNYEEYADSSDEGEEADE